MATMAAPRKSLSIHDYPEHLNPFHEEDNHNKIRFWTIGRKLNRSNSINFSGLKDLKNSWAFRSFMKKGKRSQQAEKPTKDTEKHTNGQNSPIIYRRAIQYSSMSSARGLGTGARTTVASPERYVYGGSVTPLPRSRFQERLRSSSNYEVDSLSATPRMARSEVTGSRLSVGSTNPFDEDGPVPPVRARRKKKRAPLPPGSTPNAADISITSENSELNISETNNTTTSFNTDDIDLDAKEFNLNIELKIVEDEDLSHGEPIVKDKLIRENVEILKNNLPDESKTEQTTNQEHTVQNSDSENNTLSEAPFEKIDIVKYRRNSSVNEDDIRLRRGNLEDFHLISSKRSKSLTNALDSDFTTYDINLNEELKIEDVNGNNAPQKVVCKLYEDPFRKPSIDTISSTEKEFIAIDKATRELEREISKLNSALHDDDDDVTQTGARLSVSDIKRKFDKTDISSPNPIPKPRRSYYSESGSPINGTLHNTE